MLDFLVYAYFYFISFYFIEFHYCNIFVIFLPLLTWFHFWIISDDHFSLCVIRHFPVPTLISSQDYHCILSVILMCIVAIMINSKAVMFAVTIHLSPFRFFFHIATVIKIIISSSTLTFYIFHYRFSSIILVPHIPASFNQFYVWQPNIFLTFDFPPNISISHGLPRYSKFN